MISAEGGAVDTPKLLASVRCSSVDDATMDGLRITVERLCTAYPFTPAARLLAESKAWLRHMIALLDGKLTLRQRREILSLAGWLAALAGCVEHDDIEQTQVDLATARQQVHEAQQVREAAIRDAASATRQLREIRAQIVATDEISALQEVGIYEYRHPLQDAVAYKSRLADVKDNLKAMVAAKTAVIAATSWTVNGSAQKGTAMVRDYSKLMLRAYNAEADNCVRTL